MGNHADRRFTEADAEIIKRKARRMIGQFGYRTSDVEDIEQELSMHVFQQTHRHDSERASREAFVTKIVKNKMLHLVERRTAKKRDDRRNVSVEIAGDGVLLDGSDSSAGVDIGIDVRAVLARLPDDLRQVAILGQQYTERELEPLLNLTRAQVRGRLQHLERIFRKAGLAVYSNKQQPTGAPFR